MSQKKFDQNVYNQQYYTEHKAVINQKRKNKYWADILSKELQKMDLNTQRLSIVQAFQDYDDTDNSPENIAWFNQIVAYSQLVGTIAYCNMSEEQQRQAQPHVTRMNQLANTALNLPSS
jgi:hypothetical protein